MSLTMMATCWNQRSLLCAPVGAGRPVGWSQAMSWSVAELQPYHAHARAGHALEPAVAVPGHDGVRHLAELEHRRVERDRAIHVGHRQRDRAYGGDGRTARGVSDGRCAPQLLRRERGNGERQRQDRQVGELHRKRSRMWSPTRSALAMIVSAGFTAPLDGKKLPSTT